MFQRLSNYADSILSALPANRLLAIDTFRGLTITAMILVNNPGSWGAIYAPLKHADWHGWTATDLIFPFFVFIVGVSILLSVGAQQARGVDKAAIVRHGAKRMLKLILLGWFLALFYYNFRDPSFNWLTDRLLEMRIPGVLQRLGVVYFATLLIVLYCPRRHYPGWAIGLCLLYSLLLLWVPYSDAEGVRYQGELVPGNNLAAWLDTLVFGAKHLYTDSQPFASDPEGLLSTLPAISSCLTGVIAAQYLHSKATLNQKILVLAGSGLILIVLAELLSNILPINKPLWTPSYVLLSTGFALVILAICLWLIDRHNYRRWTAPFVVFGANAIAFFMFAGVMARLFGLVPLGDRSVQSLLYGDLLQPLLGSYNGSLAYALLFLAMSYLVMHWMYKKGWFWKV
ncbi:acyltransferase family protein [Alkalimonas mucilaginosa]|uniref:Heparan-alpha-glucosaminide N-acetyltransferase domain-containing protein n=1 Tax=Alkalimonas mucilaginosa TaxID=3057676 RepID=A0ABU7JHT4_9GAMM|nr:heparan-alpha-glucosaminide N-acetyltransferase domain-containing protein [Alkalimonas sp. MEB004]MEE2025262.1 heparan-alpha-glucosaminide N-acetyltransferase domain-containing protein [Alkalimonas sp. MEB004]